VASSLRLDLIGAQRRHYNSSLSSFSAFVPDYENEDEDD
jgi:hypothetical protein